MAEPRFSIVLPVYNGAKYLREALASVRWQTLADWECVCINDGSTDGSGEILEQFAAADGRFRVVHQANAGIVAALNRGIGEAQADWIARMDADDVALPERLAVQARYVEAHPKTLVLSSHMACMDAAGLPIGVQCGPTEHAEIERRLLGGQNTINHPTVVMRRDAVVAARMYRREFEWVEDADLWLRLAQKGRLATVPQVLLKYRLHAGSVCSTRSETQGRVMREMLVAARAERGLPAEASETSSRRRRRSKRPPASHKWARRAARSGYYRTAWVYWKQQAREAPWSMTTMRAALEVGSRALGSLLQRKAPPVIDLPDWRAWDATASSLESIGKAA
jgi:glycosyltransferase involved in cell wall biosynthesis